MERNRKIKEKWTTTKLRSMKLGLVPWS